LIAHVTIFLAYIMVQLSNKVFVRCGVLMVSAIFVIIVEV
jgi:hypothetical protein